MPVKRAFDFDLAGHFGVPRTNPTWMRVITDPSVVQAHRQTVASSEKSLLDSLIDRLGLQEFSYSFLNLYEIGRLKEEAASKLEAVCRTAPLSFQSVDASLLLLRLLNKSGHQEATNILRFATRDVLARFLFNLEFDFNPRWDTTPDQYRRFLLSDTSFCENLLQLLDSEDTNIRLSAICKCQNLDVPGYEKRFRDLLISTDDRCRFALINALTELDTSEELYEVAERLPEFVREERVIGKWHIISKFLESPSDEIRNRAYEWLKRHASGVSDSVQTGSQYPQGGVIQSICNHSRASDLPWLVLMANQVKGYSENLIYQAIMRHDTELCRNTILDKGSSSKRLADALEVASQVFRDSEDCEVIDRLWAITVDCSDSTRERIAKTLLAMRGDRARLVACAMAPRLSPRWRSCLFLQGTFETIDDFLIACEEMRVLANGFREQIIQANGKYVVDAPPRSPESLVELLRTSGVILDLGIRLRDYHNSHACVLAHFANRSFGRFQPDSEVDTWIPSTASGLYGHYSLKFIHDNRLYVGRMRYGGGNMDIDRLVAMVNMALIDSGTCRRFIGLHPDGEDLEFLFGDPQHIAQLANQFYLPVSESTYLYSDGWYSGDPPACDGELPLI